MTFFTLIYRNKTEERLKYGEFYLDIKTRDDKIEHLEKENSELRKENEIMKNLKKEMKNLLKNFVSILEGMKYAIINY